MEKTKKVLAAVLLAGFLASFGGCVIADKNAIREARHWIDHQHHRR